MKHLLILLILASLLLACGGTPPPDKTATMQPSTSEPTNTPTSTPTSTPEPTNTLPSTLTSTPEPINTSKPKVTPTPVPQGLSPHAIAITKNGEFVYVGFDLSEAVLKIRLRDLAIMASADLSEYFPIESENIALDESEAKLFVYSPTWRKLIVLDTQTMSVTQTIEDIGIIGMTRSQYGPFLITLDGGNSVKFVNTETYEVTEFVYPDEFFVKIQESNTSQDLWYVVSGQGPGSSEVNVGIYDHEAKTWIRKIPLPPEARAGSVFDLEVLPNEQKAYIAIFGGWYPENHAYGWLHSVDLVSGEVKVVPIDGGAMCLAASPDSKRLYVGTGWAVPDSNNLLVLDTQSDGIVGQIPLGRTKYNWPFTQMNHMQIDPTNAQILYGTITDANAFIKVDLDSLTLNDVLIFNEETFQPYFFVGQSAQSIGYILIRRSANAFVFDLNKANVIDVIKFPMIRDDAYTYDAAINDSGRMYIAQGETIR